MRYVFVVAVEVERVAGGTYEVTSWDVEEQEQPKRVRRG
jgi:hypothetical protein